MFVIRLDCAMSRVSSFSLMVAHTFFKEDLASKSADVVRPPLLLMPLILMSRDFFVLCYLGPLSPGDLRNS